MKNFFKQIFEDNSGGFSMQRMGTAVCLIAFLAVTTVILYLSVHSKPVIIETTLHPADVTIINALIMLALGVLTAGLGIKAFQRFGEKETNIEERKTQ